MPGNEIAEFFYGIPFFTRWWFSGCILLSFVVRFGFIDAMRLILLWREGYKYQLWRPITALFFYPITPGTGFNFLMNLYFIYFYSSRLENGMYFGKPAEYSFMLCFSWILSVLFGYLVPFYYLMDPTVMIIIYIWSQLNRDVMVQFWFGMRFRAMYLPWVLLVFRFVVNGSVMAEIVGILIGHIYYFFTYQYPLEYGGQMVLKTPAFFYRIFPSPRTFVSSQAIPARQQNESNVPPRFPGRGRALGEQ